MVLDLTSFAWFKRCRNGFTNKSSNGVIMVVRMNNISRFKGCCHGLKGE